MSRRKQQQEMDMGSDSFLDIVANIVGILIILIVVAGVRVSQAPVPTSVAAENTPQSIEEEIPLGVPEEQIVPTPPEEIQVDTQLVEQVRKLETELEALQANSKNQIVLLQKLDEDVEKSEREVKQLSHLVMTLKEKRDAAEEVTKELQTAREKTKAQVDQLTRVLEEVELEETPVLELEHKVTPISKRAEGREIHFQIKHQKISVLPIEELLARMKQEIPKKLRRLIKFNRHEGEVGPIRGFRMKYIVERESLSSIDQLSQGRGMMKVAVRRWELESEEYLSAESAQTALKMDSRFQRALLNADAETTLTFWVYPDSFDAFQKIKQAAHQSGFLVAARPIPFNSPIAGSPNGTHSSSQ